MATKTQETSYPTRDWADAVSDDFGRPGRAHLLKLVKTPAGLVALPACGSRVRLHGQNGATKHKCSRCFRIYERQRNEALAAQRKS